ncbi:MAG: hypothetical protein ISR82_07085 [Candidatus Marinimicrobia bacterium]|nr:hypothetical protein [Candidatus Neomarinimicrobiota bacterium]MBL7010968.1 hypothetical protein [Candidatus Neomarinimicrobiota bacterium]MBL7031387.1 hypothetical protein [Candidatus Neomarinimicrobiota bacterium]
MEKPVNSIRKSFPFLFLFFNILSAQDSVGVDSSQSPVIKKGEEYETVLITAVVNPVNVTPTAYRLSIYPRNHPAEPFIQKLFFPGEPIQIMLPANILNTDTLGNVAKLEPLGHQYEHQYRMFNSGKGEIKLQPFTVLVPGDILKLTVLEAGSGSPIPFSKIRITQNGEMLSDSKTDSSGYVRLRIPVSRNKKEPVLMAINTNGQFPPWKGRIDIQDGVHEKTIQISSLTLEKGETIYEVIDDLAPFREGPENGAALLFFLNKGDQVVVSKVAGDRLFGRVRIYLDKQEKYHNISGWILDKYIRLKE